jgi:HlyD family secretion protein
MQVWASVNEADIGGIRKGQNVVFSVDAYPNEKFVGTVEKIRLNATMSQNVVTYVVEVITDNSSLRLLPYLSANLSFEVDRRNGALAVPNGALRFRPAENLIAGEFEREPKARYIWVKDGEKVRPIKVNASISDGAFTAIESPEISDGMEIVIGVETLSANAGKTTNPFMPKMPQRRKGNAPAKK